MRILAGFGLTLIYLAAVGSWTAWDVAAGVAFSAIGLHRFHEFVLPHPDRRLRRNLFTSAAGIARLTLAAILGFAGGTRRVLRAAWDRDARPGLVEIAVEERSEAGIAVSAFLATLTPDEFLVDISPDRAVMQLHVVDVRDEEGVKQRHHDMYKKFVEPLFP